MKAVIQARAAYAGAAIIVMAAGFISRAESDRLPPFVASHFGDALWAAMIYCGMRVLLTHKPRVWALILSLLFCFSIEFSQLYQEEWIENVRATLLGGLVLGHGFLAVDLLRYAVGILLLYGVDHYLTRWYRLRMAALR
ncbi:DUF2809 domain-containing protein [Paenibacillus sp. PL2-23]|uniref:ribosomal maturation YjgA family protein n=1 Tax=Paenibacillus sp. PL2-23 TaxID=2100729 RepID=UPI0030F68350